MPNFAIAIVGAFVGVALGFVIASYLVNASAKQKAEEAQNILNDAQLQAETIKKAAEVEAKDEALSFAPRSNPNVRSANVKSVLLKTAFSSVNSGPPHGFT